MTAHPDQEVSLFTTEVHVHVIDHEDLSELDGGGAAFSPSHVLLGGLQHAQGGDSADLLIMYSCCCKPAR
jgi:hypothetical protein